MGIKKAAIATTAAYKYFPDPVESTDLFMTPPVLISAADNG
jgi:hypothetical protein